MAPAPALPPILDPSLDRGLDPAPAAAAVHPARPGPVPDLVPAAVLDRLVAEHARRPRSTAGS